MCAHKRSRSYFTNDSTRILCSRDANRVSEPAWTFLDHAAEKSNIKRIPTFYHE